MKITKKELKKMIREALRNRLQESGSDFTAKRQIVAAAQSASMDFEKQIQQLLGLEDPDNMQPELQSRYLAVAKKMSNGIITAVVDATKELSHFPRKESEKPNA